MAVELVSGSIAEWMVGTRTNLQDIRARASYTPPGEGAAPVVDEPMALRIQGSNAQSRVYATTGSFDPAEPMPTGLAAALLSSISALQYEGRISLVESEAAAISYLPCKVNIDGGRTEWASMAAQVYRVSYDLDSGRTSIDFGPAAHLAAGDLFQLFRNVRTRIPGSGSMRASSAASGSGSLGTRYPSVDSLAGGSGVSALGFYLYFTVGDPGFLSMATVMDGYDPEVHDHWSILLGVSGTNFTAAVSYSDQVDLYDSSPQTFWAIPVIRNGQPVTLGGTYREFLGTFDHQLTAMMLKVS